MGLEKEFYDAVTQVAELDFELKEVRVGNPLLFTAADLALGYLCSLLRNGHSLPRWTSLCICTFRGACASTSR